MTTPEEQTVLEEQVLLPRHPAAAEEDWPEFVLCDVEVLSPGQPSQYVNLLEASKWNPVQVTGRLELRNRDLVGLVRDPNYSDKRIVIDNVTRFVYRRDKIVDNIGLWIAGKAGWYMIERYRPVYAQTVEEGDLLLFLVHQHGKRPRDEDGHVIVPRFGDLCRKYVKHTHGFCSNADNAEKVIYKHRRFLLDRMRRGEGAVDWESTDVFGRLRSMVREEEETRLDPPRPRKSFLRPASSGKRPSKTRRGTAGAATSTSSNPQLPSLSDEEEPLDDDRELPRERRRRTPPLSSSSDEEPDDEEEQWPSSTSQQTVPADLLHTRDRQDDTQMRLDLVVEECQRSRGRGVNHLLDRILEMKSSPLES